MLYTVRIEFNPLIIFERKLDVRECICDAISNEINESGWMSILGKGTLTLAEEEFFKTHEITRLCDTSSIKDFVDDESWLFYDTSYWNKWYQADDTVIAPIAVDIDLMRIFKIFGWA